MKSCVLISFLLIAVTAIAAAPYEPLTSDNGATKHIGAEPMQQPEERAARRKRVTCDLLGLGFDTACAAHCMSLGKAGGHCNDEKICICRSDTLETIREQGKKEMKDVLSKVEDWLKP